MSEYNESEFLYCDKNDIELEEIRLLEYREKRIDTVFNQWVDLQDDPVFVEYIFSSNSDIIDELNIKINKYVMDKKINEELSIKRLLIKEQNDAYEKSMQDDIKKQELKEHINKCSFVEEQHDEKLVQPNEQKPTLEQIRSMRVNYFLKL